MVWQVMHAVSSIGSGVGSSVGVAVGGGSVGTSVGVGGSVGADVGVAGATETSVGAGGSVGAAVGSPPHPTNIRVSKNSKPKRIATPFHPVKNVVVFLMGSSPIVFNGSAVNPSYHKVGSGAITSPLT